MRRAEERSVFCLAPLQTKSRIALRLSALLRRLGGFGAARAGVGVLGGREAALAHILGVFARGGTDLVAEVAVALDEFGGELGEEAEHVVDDEDLAVAGRRAADTDGR